MSLHLINNVKDQSRQQNPDNLPSPVLTGNTSRPTYLATNTATPGNNQATGKTGCTASVKPHIWRPTQTVNIDFSTTPPTPPKTPTTPAFPHETFLSSTRINTRITQTESPGNMPSPATARPAEGGIRVVDVAGAMK